MMAPWQPYCGAEFHGPVAGRPVICDSPAHPDTVMHRNSETGYEWWGFMSYPVARPVPDPSPPAEPLIRLPYSRIGQGDAQRRTPAASPIRVPSPKPGSVR